ncbi:MAG: type II toxin-antitoxin system RelE/ParE family toxin [Chitinophagaceae bacterium]
MVYAYRLHEQAHEEYINAYCWYEIKQKGLGERFMKCVEKRLNQISEHPEYYSKIQGKYRAVKVENFPYTIIYEFFRQKQFIHIAAIYHTKRNPKSKFRRK